MSPFAFLPLLTFATCATITWAVGKYAEASVEQREHASKYPRSRPYPLTLPVSLMQE